MAMAKGERVYLRALADTDGAAFVAAARASRALHRGWVNPPVTSDAFARRMQRNASDTRFSGLLVIRRNDDAVLGVLNLSEIIRGPLQQAFLGYYAFAPHERQGYMREGLALLLDHAFRRLKLHRIEANIQPGNVSSIALCRASGFVREGFSARFLKLGGRWRDHERWAINADQWRAQRRAAPIAAI
ncbi:MAG: GNAT family protein [Betaproteobacteria bacterium]